MPSTPPRRRLVWRVLVPVVCLGAGFGFAVSARESGGTDLRPPGTENLRDVVARAELHVRADDQQVAALQRQIDAATAREATRDAAVAGAQRGADVLRTPGGLTPVHGPGLTVLLDDAHTAVEGVDPNQLVVHQDDLQAVVNALWAGGAEAMSIAGQRVIATSAVRCVGNTLLLNGEVFSPPYRVVAIGPAHTMSAALDASPGVTAFVDAAGAYGLGWTVASADRVDGPAYAGAIQLRWARVGR